MEVCFIVASFFFLFSSQHDDIKNITLIARKGIFL